MGNMLHMQCTNVHTRTSLTKGFCAIIMWSTSCVMDNHSFL